VWKNFKHVLVDQLGSDYVACISCWRVITYKKKDGTKGMHSHKCTESEMKPTQQKISSFVERRPAPQHASDNLKTELVKFLATDIRPFSSVTGIGFQSFCQTLVYYGARYGQSDVTKALPDRTTIARHVPEVVTHTTLAWLFQCVSTAQRDADRRQTADCVVTWRSSSSQRNESRHSLVRDDCYFVVHAQLDRQPVKRLQ